MLQFLFLSLFHSLSLSLPSLPLSLPPITHNYRVSLSILTAQKTRVIPWEEREPRVFFRGRDSNKARLEMVKEHRKNTHLFDVGITNWFFFTHDEDVYGPKMKPVSFHDFFKVGWSLNVLLT